MSAMTKAWRQFTFFMPSPLHTATAKASIDSPTPTMNSSTRPHETSSRNTRRNRRGPSSRHDEAVYAADASRRRSQRAARDARASQIMRAPPIASVSRRTAPRRARSPKGSCATRATNQHGCRRSPSRRKKPSEIRSSTMDENDSVSTGPSRLPLHAIELAKHGARDAFDLVGGEHATHDPRALLTPRPLEGGLPRVVGACATG